MSHSPAPQPRCPPSWSGIAALSPTEKDRSLAVALPRSHTHTYTHARTLAVSLTITHSIFRSDTLAHTLSPSRSDTRAPSLRHVKNAPSQLPRHARRLPNPARPQDPRRGLRLQGRGVQAHQRLLEGAECRGAHRAGAPPPSSSTPRDPPPTRSHPSHLSTRRCCSTANASPRSDAEPRGLTRTQGPEGDRAALTAKAAALKVPCRHPCRVPFRLPPHYPPLHYLPSQSLVLDWSTYPGQPPSSGNRYFSFQNLHEN